MDDVTSALMTEHQGGTVNTLVGYTETSASALGVLAGAALIGIAAMWIFWKVFRRIASRTLAELDDSIHAHLRKPTLLLAPVLAVRVARPFLKSRLEPGLIDILTNVLAMLAVLGVAWLLISIIRVLEDLVLSRYDVTVADNLQARRIHTQMRIVRRVLVFIIVIVALGVALMQYETFRSLGTGILASAGIAGLVVGLAAQKSLSNLLAGIQIAITQPVRLDDVVIVEGEWGRVEEITLTYVVVRIWDQRRLIIPIGYFLEKPFQNWTRVSADLLGTVYLYVDYTVPLDGIRAELKRILEASPDWDGKVQAVQVTNASERTVEVRALMSASDSSKAWSLRCEVREKLITFLKERHPGALPRLRAELEPLGEKGLG
jgi:small-conductance mechanosensitive channel